MSEYIPINFSYYNPKNDIFKAGKSDRETVYIYTCNNSNNCEACKNNKCVMLNGFFHSCPYGKMKKEEGYTKVARKCGELIQKRKNEYGDVAYSKKELKYLCYIGDYVYLPLPHLINYSNSIRDKDFFKGDGDIIKKEDFTPEFIVELLKYKPRTLFNEEITSYQKNNVPMFCIQLKRYMPDMFKKVKKLYPDIDSIIQNINYCGKRAKVKTLLPGKIKLNNDILEWDGTIIKAKGHQISFWGLNNENIAITPTENTYVTIIDNNTVTEDTELED